MLIHPLHLFFSLTLCVPTLRGQRRAVPDLLRTGNDLSKKSSSLTSNKMTNPRKRTGDGTSVSYNQLQWAIRWESIRQQYFELYGRFAEADRCRALARLYVRRSREEAAQEVFQ